MNVREMVTTKLIQELAESRLWPADWGRVRETAVVFDFADLEKTRVRDCRAGHSEEGWSFMGKREGNRPDRRFVPAGTYTEHKLRELARRLTYVGSASTSFTPATTALYRPLTHARQKTFATICGR